MADFAGSIRKIAKTDELKEKVDRLIQNEQNPVKSNIVTQRRTAYADSTGSTNVDTGGGAGGGVTVGTDKDGTPVLGPPAPPPTPDQQNTQTSATDSALQSLLNNNTDSQNNTNNDPNSTDKTDSTHQTANNGGGSAFADQGLLGENNPDWLNIKNAMIANGASADDIAKARIAFLRKELGIDEVGDVFTGKTGAQPADTSNATNSQSTNTQGANASPTQTQRGFVGVDPDTVASAAYKAVMARMDGWQPSPSDADAAADDQNPWVDGQPPLQKGFENFQLGYYWQVTNPRNALASTPDAAAKASIDTFIAEDTRPYPTGNGSVVYDPPTVSTVDGSGIPTSYIYTWRDHPGGSPNNVTIIRGTCTVQGLDICPIEPPLESTFPLTGIGVLSWIGGQFVKSPFDSEAPLKYTTPQSVAKIYSLSTNTEYQVEPAINGGFMLSETVDTPYIMVYASNGQLVSIVPPDLKIFYTPR